MVGTQRPHDEEKVSPDKNSGVRIKGEAFGFDPVLSPWEQMRVRGSSQPAVGRRSQPMPALERLSIEGDDSYASSYSFCTSVCVEESERHP